MKNKLYPIVEIFDSIEGEGKRAGEMAIFVRFAGCNLRCSYCDTSYALSVKDAVEHITEDELVNRIKAYPWRNVTLTGGEPLLQSTKDLIIRLARENFDVNIETNGSIAINTDLPCFYTMDFKCMSSGESEKMLQSNFRKLRHIDVVKFVVGNREDLEQAYKVGDSIPLWCRLYLSPVFGFPAADIVEFMKEKKSNRFQLQLQMHKYVYPPDMRGV